MTNKHTQIKKQQKQNITHTNKQDIGKGKTKTKHIKNSKSNITK